MGPVGFPEMVVIFLVALVLFGPKELPRLAKTIARTLAEFRRATGEMKATWQREIDALDQETKDVREGIKRDLDPIHQSLTGNTDSYNYDSYYDYGSGSSYSSTGVDDPAAATAATGYVAGSETYTQVEGTSPAPESPATTPDAAPSPIPAQGTVPTAAVHLPAEPPPATPAAPGPSEHASS